MSIFTPEQQVEIDQQVAAAKIAIHDEYDAKAHKFRNWVNTHDAVWAAQRFSAIGAILGGVTTYYVSGLVRAIVG